MTRIRSAVAFLAVGALAGCVSLKRTPEARFFALRSAMRSSAPLIGCAPPVGGGDPGAGWMAKRATAASFPDAP